MKMTGRHLKRTSLEIDLNLLRNKMLAKRCKAVKLEFP